MIVTPSASYHTQWYYYYCYKAKTSHRFCWACSCSVKGLWVSASRRFVRTYFLQIQGLMGHWLGHTLCRPHNILTSQLLKTEPQALNSLFTPLCNVVHFLFRGINVFGTAQQVEPLCTENCWPRRTNSGGVGYCCVFCVCWWLRRAESDGCARCDRTTDNQ